MENQNLVILPPRKSNSINHGNAKSPREEELSEFEAVDTSPLNEIDLQSIRFVQVKGTSRESLWNSLVRKHHYLGFNIFVGRSLKYLVYSNERIVAALGVSDPAWSLSVRDDLLLKLGLPLEIVRSRCVNNGRFLIMPWVQTDNLASFILSEAVPRICRDWREYYSVDVLMLETFVDPTRFKGTCYKAANWVLIGETRGYKKSGNSHHNSQASKMIFVYPVTGKMRKALASQIAEQQ